MPSFTGEDLGSKKKEVNEERKVKDNFEKSNTYDSNTDAQRSHEVKKALRDVVSISVNIDGENVETNLMKELDIPYDNPVKINEAVSKHSSRQAFYGMLHNIAKRRVRGVKKEFAKTEEELENYIKEQKPNITKRLYEKHENLGFKKPNKDQISDAVDTYSDSKVENLKDRIGELEEKVEDAIQLEDDLYVAYRAFIAQKDDLITLSSNWRHDSDLFKGINKHRGDKA